jgi:hypothetical protein
LIVRAHTVTPTSKRKTSTKKAPGAAKKPRLKHVVCKPCWELKYCPYGPLVEYFPLVDEEDPIPLAQVKKSYKSWLTAGKSGDLKTETEVFQAIEKILCLSPTENYVND